ncbi:MAG: cytochrome c nitrite reductase small subunit [Candidatus Sumerlaeia bacterium]
MRKIIQEIRHWDRGDWRKVIKRLAPPLVILAVCLGAMAGLGAYTFYYADGFSYMTNDPKACANCHVMQDHLDAWRKGSHHDVAVCNDCHTPHNFFGKYFIKGLNGFNHSRAFTFQNFHEPIQITPLNTSVTEGACRYCHGDIVDMIDHPKSGREKISCIRCHAHVGHYN